MGSGLVFCFLLYSYKRYFLLVHYIAYDPSLFINGKRNVAESHTEDRKYPCRFDACNEILKRLYDIFETGKKQDLTPLWYEIFDTGKKQDLTPLWYEIFETGKKQDLTPLCKSKKQDLTP